VQNYSATFNFSTDAQCLPVYIAYCSR